MMLITPNMQGNR